MPSRLVHNIIRHLLETSDVHFDMPPSGEDVRYYRNLYIQEFGRIPHLKRYIRFSELQDLSTEYYSELLETLHGMIDSGRSLDFGRRFRGVHVINMEMIPNLTAFETDIRLEFIVTNPDEDHWRREERSVRRDILSSWDGCMDWVVQPPTVNPMINPDGVCILGQKYMKDTNKKKTEKHFEDDLFKL